MTSLKFAHPVWLYLLPGLLLMIAWYVWRQRKLTVEVRYSSTGPFASIARPWRQYLRHLVFTLWVLALGLIVVAMAQPQSVNQWEEVSTEGIDIVLALDISSSMLAQDFQPDRLEASKDVAIRFISGRPDDRIGLVVFSGESFTQCPLTTDHAVLINLFREIKSGMIDDGTAIGDGLATAVNRLKESKARSKVIILLTDGVNNSGEVPPMTAAEIAGTFGIRVYTIGVGTEGMAPYPVQTAFGLRFQQMRVQIDEKLLKKIAQMTGGRYFRATDNNKLQQIYDEIDQLEKSKIDVKKYSRREEKFFPFVLWAAILLLTGEVLRQTFLRTGP